MRVKSFMSRAEIDKLAWATIKSRPPLQSTPTGFEHSGRPRNYAELEQMLAQDIDFEHAWSEFLHESYAFKQASFFEFPSPKSLSLSWQALLAGAAEFLSQEFGLPVPAWVNEPQYFLPEFWDPAEDLIPGIEEGRERRLQNTPEAFLKRKVVFEARNLITL